MRQAFVRFISMPCGKPGRYQYNMLAFSNKFSLINCLLLGAVFLVLGGCSVESKNPIARGYHNVAARDNGFFLAREILKETEAKIAAEAVNDYTQVLPVLYPISEAQRTGMATTMEDVVKKASFPIVRHKGSRYDDDSYVLIGKARYYKGEFEEAVKTFKYANSISKDNFAKHQALVWLMRTYLALEEIDNVTAVSDFLKREEKKMDKLSAKELYLTRAQFAMRNWEVKKIIANLELALPNSKKRDEKARINFILAQLYQQTGNDAKAFEHYTNVIKARPPYELGFHARLNMGQVSNLADASNTKKINKYYAKLLRDEKNKEYKDKIYYEMARFELKQNNTSKALGLLEQSLRAESKNTNQKIATHLLTGQVYYGKLQDYRKAQAYYDSTVMLMNAKSPDYAFIKERRDVLTDFVKQLTIIEQEDSLQRLGTMPEAELSAYLDNLIKAEQERQQREREAQEAAALAQEQNGAENSFLENKAPGTNSGDQGGTWYFYNPATVGSARTEFGRIWGNRTLSDNWRRLNKETQAPAPVEDEAPAATSDTATIDPEVARAKEAEAMKSALMARIPRDPAALAASTERLQNAYFALGNIYNLELKEPKKGAETFEKLLQRFPTHPKKVEVYYSLYLIYSQLKDERAELYRTKIISEYPTSTYAKLLANPNYLKENLVKNEEARDMYDSAFVLYEKGNFPRAKNLVASIQQRYPQSDIDDRLFLLNVLITGRTDTLALYKQGLVQFIDNYKASPLVPYAQELLKKYTEFETRSPEQLAQVNKTEKVDYLEPAGGHYFVLIYDTREKSLKNLNNKYSDFNAANYSALDLKTADVLLNDSTVLYTVRQFEDSKAAMRYLERQRAKFSPLDGIPENKYKMFIISTGNYPLFYRSKDLDQYMSFFRKKYF